MIRMTLHRFIRVPALVLFLLGVEFLDELVYGANEAALPLIQADIGLTYTQIGLLFAIPSIVASFIEPIIGIQADMGKRRVIVLGGGIAFAIALIGIATAQTYLILLAIFVVLFPASGAFVGISQAVLMDLEPDRHEHNMARWTFAGSLGMVGGSLLVVLITSLGVSWRVMFIGFGVLTAVLVIVGWRYQFAPPASPENGDIPNLREGLKEAFAALRNRTVLRWLVLLQFSDLMLDVLYTYLALYFVNSLEVTPQQAALGVTVWTVVGLIGDFALIPLLERVRGLTYLRISAVLELMLYPAFLLIEPFAAKLIILGIIGFFNAGWYAILQGQVYSAMPGRSGTAMATGAIFGLIGSLLPAFIGLAADQIGLETAMWLLLLGPITLILGIPRINQVRGEVEPAS